MMQNCKRSLLENAQEKPVVSPKNCIRLLPINVQETPEISCSHPKATNSQKLKLKGFKSVFLVRIQLEKGFCSIND